MNTEKYHNQSERGQVIVILSIAIVGLLGFAALALDGGMLYSDRRHAQNAADTSSLAGATSAAIFMRVNDEDYKYDNFFCYSDPSLKTLAESEAITAGINRAASNDYTIDSDISDHHGVTTECISEDKGSYIDKHFDVITQITRETTSNFAHLVFSGTLTNEVEAIARVYPPAPLGFGHAIVSLNNSPCSGNQNGVIFSGSSETQITGGGVWSNGCLTGNGSEFTVNVDDGDVGYAGESTGTLGNISPPPQHHPNEIPSFATKAQPPDCSGLPNRKAPHGKSATLKPGIYDRIQWTSGDLTLESGLYCITGSQGVTVNGGSLTGIGVTIYLENGGMTVDGNVEPVDLEAPPESPDPSPAIPGMLIFLAPGNTNTVKLTGNSDSFYLGAIYAPDGDIYISGTSDTNPTFNTQLIAENVEVSGGASIDINFLDEENYMKPPVLDLQK